MSLPKGQHAGAIHSHQIIILQQPPWIQHFLANQRLDHATHGFLHFLYFEPLEAVIQAVPVRYALHPKQGLKLGF